MESKIRIKLGPIEVEYEGSEAFLKQELPDLIRTVSELYQSVKIQVENEGSEEEGNTDGGDQDIKLSTSSIATKLAVSSGTDLAVAAAAHLAFVKKKNIFTRNDLLQEMRTATSFYKLSYGSNLSKTLAVLLKSKFNEPSSGKYALTGSTKKELRSNLV